MTPGETPPHQNLSRRQLARLRLAGLLVLLLGLGGAGLVYWLGARSQDSAGDLSMVGANRAAARQAGILYGRWGLMSEDLMNAIKSPGVQAASIAVVCMLIAGACFYLGRPLDPRDEPR